MEQDMEQDMEQVDNNDLCVCGQSNVCEYFSSYLVRVLRECPVVVEIFRNGPSMCSGCYLNGLFLALRYCYMTRPSQIEVDMTKHLAEIAINILVVSDVTQNIDDAITQACDKHDTCFFCTACTQYKEIGYCPSIIREFHTGETMTESEIIEVATLLDLLVENYESVTFDTFVSLNTIIQRVLHNAQSSMSDVDMCPTKLRALRRCADLTIMTIAGLSTPNEVADQNMLHHNLVNAEYKSPHETISEEDDVRKLFPCTVFSDADAEKNKSDICCICLDVLKHGDEIFNLECCNTTFHYKEFCTYLHINGLSCPKCRIQIKKKTTV